MVYRFTIISDSRRFYQRNQNRCRGHFLRPASGHIVFIATMQTMYLLTSVTKDEPRTGGLLEDMVQAARTEPIFDRKDTAQRAVGRQQRMVYVFDPLDSRMFSLS